MKHGKNKRKMNGRVRLEQSLRGQARLDQQAENRRKLIAKLDRKSALRITQDFARMGLYQ